MLPSFFRQKLEQLEDDKDEVEQHEQHQPIFDMWSLCSKVNYFNFYLLKHKSLVNEYYSLEYLELLQTVKGIKDLIIRRGVCFSYLM